MCVDVRLQHHSAVARREILTALRARTSHYAITVGRCDSALAWFVSISGPESGLLTATVEGPGRLETLTFSIDRDPTKPKAVFSAELAQRIAWAIIGVVRPLPARTAPQQFPGSNGKLSRDAPAARLEKHGWKVGAFLMASLAMEPVHVRPAGGVQLHAPGASFFPCGRITFRPVGSESVHAVRARAERYAVRGGACWRSGRIVLDLHALVGILHVSATSVRRLRMHNRAFLDWGLGLGLTHRWFSVFGVEAGGTIMGTVIPQPRFLEVDDERLLVMSYVELALGLYLQASW